MVHIWRFLCAYVRYPIDLSHINVLLYNICPIYLYIGFSWDTVTCCYIPYTILTYSLFFLEPHWRVGISPIDGLRYWPTICLTNPDLEAYPFDQWVPFILAVLTCLYYPLWASPIDMWVGVFSAALACFYYPLWAYPIDLRVGASSRPVTCSYLPVS